MAYTTINKPTDYFNTVLYTGDGSSGRTINVGFQSDFVWYKERGSTDYHTVFDAIRGATKRIFPNATEAESTNSESLQSFVSNGYTIGNNSGTNGNGDTYVSWNWKANGAGSSNTDGSITSTVSASTTSGFSIVKYTGTGANATIGHGLGSNVNMVIIKDISGARDWIVGHTSLGFNKYVLLNSTASSVTASNRFQDTAPSSSVVTIGTHGLVNNSGSNYIAYCFAEKQGYSKFGSYAGNNNADGTFVYTGFKPKLIMVKRITNGYDWIMYTNEINGINPMNDYLAPNSNAAEVQNNANQVLDIVSNGFKHRGTGASTNGSADYIYMAFGQSLVGSNNVPCTAR